MEPTIKSYIDALMVDDKYICEELTKIIQDDLKRWLKKSKEIQWDYKIIVKRRGVLERLVWLSV